MKPRHEEGALAHDPKAAPEEASPGAVQPTPGDAEQPKGLAGVDVEPVPPITREEIEALRQERDGLLDQLLRKRADLENYRKRVERDRHHSGIEAAAAIFRALIPTLDNLERALKADASEASLRPGVELIHRDLLALLEAQGVVSLDPSGQRFDPTIHQALSTEITPGVAEGTVVEVLRKGYFFKDRLLRPALVKVAKGEAGANGGGSEAVH